MSKQLNTIIVDDEPLARKGLAVRLQEHKDINIIVQCTNGREALEAVRAYQPDLIFLDIQMPGLNGFEVVEAIIAQGLHLPMVVFVTAFDQYAMQAFEVHAQDYLLKPADEQRLAQTLDKIRQSISSEVNALHKSKLVRLVSDVTGNDCDKILQELENNEPVSVSSYSDVLAIKDAGEVSRVPVKDILWIDAAGDYMCVHTDDNTHILRKTMKQLEAVLDPRRFLRSHRSTIVNKSYIDKFCSQPNGEYYLVMTNGKELKVSRSYKEKVKKAVVA
ncbi:response regulator transcription factor [Colwellia sp. MB02u-10]|jgi:two-component system LytT family response regulator|uniref:LytR/AlgR family response regulator transcription factor n=1 Tax=Colwellia sp. MB02u-10 TaxID=2759828 RepID=UPI0015F42393|nr:LytTR family DNA-binding domain-containing protein [Colwellia sp. MB02u-10]MBA6342634.1 response regulator transcription factor [Colwellia sp. MB02u-10]